MNQDELAQSSAKRASRVSAACISCRNKHVRCDAKQPECGRCLSDGTQCQFVKSRRGGLFKAQLEARRNRPLAVSPPPSSSGPTEAAALAPELTFHTPVLSPEPHPQQAGDSTDVWTEKNCNAEDNGSLEGQLHVEPLSIANCSFIELYYRYFHNCHPCVLPWRRLRNRYEATSKRKRMIPLVSVMRYIGSLFARSNLSSQLNQLARNAISNSQGDVLNPFMVQCHLLYSIALFWCNDKIKSQEHMDAAVRTALDLGMFGRQFAVENGEGDAVLEESWRRTWWQVYITDATFAAIRREAAFPTCNVDVLAELPCEEADYRDGAIPIPKTLEDFENREFALEPHVYSSFAYLIGATRCTSSAAAVFSPDVSCWDSQKILAEADAIMDGWQLLLPKSKREMLGKDGQADELMFQAQMLLNTTTIVFHRPFSELLFSPRESISTCSNGPPDCLPAQESVIVHTMRCLQAIEAQVRLIALPSPPLQHTPFIICMVNESAIPLLSACKFLFTGQKLLVARSQLRLMIGSLKRLAEVWSRAAKNVQELQAIAREVLIQTSREQNVTPPGDIPQYGGGVEPVQSSDPWLLEHWDDLMIPTAPLTSLDTFWDADMQTDMLRWFDHSQQ